MKPLLRLLLWCAASLAFNGHADVDISPVFAEAFFENKQTTNTAAPGVGPAAVAIWAGGNVGAYPSPRNPVPQADGILINGKPTTIRLEYSAFGQMAAGPLGYPAAVSDLNASGLAQLHESSSYATFSTLTSDLQRKTNSWDIRFPGVVNEQDGALFGAAGQNYFEERNHCHPIEGKTGR
jgi:hypothetical protein